MRRYVFAILLGLSGAGVLIGLGLWQVQRLAWKEDFLARIETRISGPAVPLPLSVDPVRDQYLPVLVQGTLTGDELRVLASLKQTGAGYRVIAVLMTDTGRRILVDRGFLPEDARAAVAPKGPVRINGNLHWPDEVDRFTPAPDAKTGLWFARDVPAMAKALATEPVLVVTWAAEPMQADLIALPVDTTRIPNDHLTYAITWFSLAGVWLGMTAYLLWRIRQRTA